MNVCGSSYKEVKSWKCGPKFSPDIASDNLQRPNIALQTFQDDECYIKIAQ